MKKKHIKYIIASVIAILIVVLLILIYNNLFASSNNKRNGDIKDYVITTEEINSVKEKFSGIEEVESVDVTTHSDVNSRRISIVVKLSKDVDFEKMKKSANEVFSSFSEKNLGYYDIHITIDSKQEDSIYPKMGTKVKRQEDNDKLEFNWSR